MKASKMNLRTVTRGASTLTITMVIVGLLASTALAYWTTMGGGFGQATAGTLHAPTGVAADPISGNATALRVTWSHPGGLQPTSYGVTAGSQSCTATYPAATCDVSGLAANTGYSVVVTSRYKTAWTASAAAVTGTTNPAAPGLTITSPADGATGVAINTAISGGTNATGNVSVALYLGSDTSTVSIGSLTGTVSGVTWTTPPATLLNSTTYTAVATQSTAGGTSTAQTTFTTAAPAVTQTAAPSTPDLLADDDSGTVAGASTDNNTNVLKPRFTGTAPAGSLVKLFRAGVEIGSEQLATGATTWTITPAADVTEGKDVAVTATAKLPLLTESSPSGALTVTFDRTVPATLSLVGITSPAGTKNVAGTATRTATDADVVATVEFSVTGSGCSLSGTSRSVLQSGSSYWDALSVSVPNNGTCAVTVTQKDKAGNTQTANASYVKP